MHEEINELICLNNRLDIDYKWLENRSWQLEDKNNNLNSYLKNLEIIYRNLSCNYIIQLYKLSFFIITRKLKAKITMGKSNINVLNFKKCATDTTEVVYSFSTNQNSFKNYLHFRNTLHLFVSFLYCLKKVTHKIPAFKMLVYLVRNIFVFLKVRWGLLTWEEPKSILKYYLFYAENVFWIVQFKIDFYILKFLLNT